MKLVGRCTLADLYISEKTGNTTLTLIPSGTGGIMKVTVDGQVSNIVPGEVMMIDGDFKPVTYPGGGSTLILRADAIKKVKTGE